MAGLSHSGFSRATSPTSVVQTGVKSFGWLNNTPQLLAEPLVEMRMPALGAVLLEIGRDLTQLQRHAHHPSRLGKLYHGFALCYQG